MLHLPFMRRIKNDKLRGGSAVELALILPILTLIFLGISQYGVAAYDLSSLDAAVRAASAYAAKNPTDTAGIKAVVQAAGGNLTKAATVTSSKFCQCSDGTSVSCSGYCYQGTVRQYMLVSASISYKPPLSLATITSASQAAAKMLPLSPPSTLSAKAIMRIQ